MSNGIDLLAPAFTIAMLCAIESLLSAVVADGMLGTRHDSNQGLIGQGVANIAAPLFHGIAAMGVIARTATNIRNGGTSPIADVVSALTLVLIVVVLSSLAGEVPLAALAAILFVVAWNMGDMRHFVRMACRAPIADVTILLITFLLTIAADLVIAVNVGVLLDTLHFLRRMSASVEVTSALADQDGMAADDVPVFAIDGPFFFAAVDQFECPGRIQHRTKGRYRALAPGAVHGHHWYSGTGDHDHWPARQRGVGGVLRGQEPRGRQIPPRRGDRPRGRLAGIEPRRRPGTSPDVDR